MARCPHQLLKTTLCVHGRGCDYPDCRFAHGLDELRSPDESRVSFSDQWRLCRVDRFYGQRMSAEQLERIKTYFHGTPTSDLPLWVIGLNLLDTRCECVMGFAYSWDFGLSSDHRELVDRRYDRECPFDTYERLWDRLEARRERLLLYRYPVHELILYEPPDDDEDDDDNNDGDSQSLSIRPTRVRSPASSISRTSSQTAARGDLCLRRVRPRLA